MKTPHSNESFISSFSMDCFFILDNDTAQKIKFSIQDFFSKYDQIRKLGHIYWRNP